MKAGLFRPLRWFDGLRGRIAAALLLALMAQFIGSDIIFERIEAQRMERGRAQRLADWLSFADEFAGAHPDALARMTALWQPDLIVSRSAATPPGRGPQGDAEAARVEKLVRIARQQMEPLRFRAVREGRDLTGSMRLSSGGWLVFRAKDYFVGRSQIYRYMTSALLLLLCVVLIVLLFGRMIARPLKRIADAAELVGREENVPILVEGPREVRQVAAAIDRMQSRLLTQLNDRVQAMAAMSHDLRTPLARMRLNAASVGDADARIALQQDVDEMEGFVSSVLDYLRGDEAEGEKRADIASIVMTVVDEARDRGEAAEYAGPHRLETMTRPLKLKRLVRNIVENATRHAGNVRVLLEEEEETGTIRILVTDNGPGIPEGEQDAVFEPFYRVETSRNRQTGGSGLGLPIARRLVTRLDGTIRLYNQRTGGLEVTITLPRLG